MPELLLDQALKVYKNFDFAVSAGSRKAAIVYHESDMRAALTGITMVIQPGSENSLIVGAFGRFSNKPGRSGTDETKLSIGSDGKTEIIQSTPELEIPSLMEMVRIGLKVFQAFDEYPEGVIFGPYRMLDRIVPIIGSNLFMDYRFSGSVGPDHKITLPYQEVFAGMMNQRQETSISA